MSTSEAKISPSTLAWVFAALLVLLALTYWLSFKDLGRVGTPLSYLIAGAKALLILSFFMELKISSRVVLLFAILGFYWLLVLIGLTMADFMTRNI